MAFADVDDPTAKLEQRTGQADAETLKSAIEGASWQVQGVNWIYEQVTGQNLVESLISPITGDFAKIEQNAKAWTDIAESLRAVRRNLNHGVSDLRQSWDGAAAVAFETMMVGTWTAALEADAAVADLVSTAFTKAADTSKTLCSKILELITKLVNRLIQAACTAWIPVGGWANAVRIVIRCVDIVFMIMDLIQAIIRMYEGVKQVVEGVESTGTSLAKIQDVASGDGPRGTGDAVNAALDRTRGLSDSVSGVTDGVDQVREGATRVRGGASDVRRTASDMRGDASTDQRDGADQPRSAGRRGGTGSQDGAGRRTSMSGEL
ncbi:WXG100 family type VII secretion target [Actinopolyspora xinjiangensis]|uniref:WXG100 family type VII secretion target n=1 Tax=Actinopolyspora xinjiangensis TaxID=405564 RepID=A0A1H0W9Y7_9ACTN|nr:WXG100 family type VII secretion target [Actinopolyspora xinjiangensis]SDP87458.1 WXG100 family type VII secretion target [Actinopolyspora xinjiangensis]